MYIVGIRVNITLQEGRQMAIGDLERYWADRDAWRGDLLDTPWALMDLGFAIENAWVVPLYVCAEDF